MIHGFALGYGEANGLRGAQWTVRGARWYVNAETAGAAGVGAYHVYNGEATWHDALNFAPAAGRAVGYGVRKYRAFRSAANALDDAAREIGNIDVRWKNLPTEARKAVNDVMTEFGSGSDGARKLLEQVRSGARPKPSTISDDTLRVYRDFVQKKYDELSTIRPDKNIDVMRDRLEIYRIWLGE